MWRKSPVPSNRGPPQQQHTQSCVRCGDPHDSSRCPYYAYYKGPPCEDCNFLHHTEAHKKLRSGSGKRTNQQASSIVQQHQTEIVPSVVPNSNQVNYFETKNFQSLPRNITGSFKLTMFLMRKKYLILKKTRFQVIISVIVNCLIVQM